MPAFVTANQDHLVRKRILILGTVAILGHLLGIIADLLSGFSPSTQVSLGNVTSLSLNNIAPLLAAKPLNEARIGHYLAILFIPLGLCGVYQVYQGLAPRQNKAALLVLLPGSLGLVYATFYHGTLAFVIGALQEGVDTPLLSYFNSLSEPLSTILLLADVSVSLSFVYVVLSRETHFQRWMAAVNPLTIQLALSLLIWITPHPVDQALWLTVFNLSLSIWYAVTTWTLARRPYRIASTRSSAAGAP
jgi:hypothetical protein